MSTINGTELSDKTLVGSAEDDTISGLGGDDLITTGTGTDLASGGAGKDTLVVDYSTSTTKVTMSSLIDTGIVRAGTGFPAPGGTDFSGVFNSDHTVYTATYSNLDLSQADHIWLAAGNPDLALSGISDDGKTATVHGSYTFSYLGSETSVTYTIAGTVSEGTWALPEDIGVDGPNAVHQVGSSTFNVSYAIDIEVPEALQGLYDLVKDFGDSYIENQIKGQFYYDDAGKSGDITDGNGNTASFDDVENFVITTGSAGSDLTTGDGDDTLIGGSGADVFRSAGGLDHLNGNSGNDTLIGGADVDILDGGAGNDTAIYSDDHLSIAVILNRSHNASVKIDGTKEDTIRNIENVVAGRSADTLTGDALANRLTGNGGNDALNGSAGNDILIGGAGKDALSGGAGHDIFVFVVASDSVGARRDTIEDFSNAQKDAIDLSAIDARSSTKADNIFHFLTAEGAAFRHADDLHWLYKGSGTHQTTWVEGDVDGDRRADFTIMLDGHIALTAASFDL